VIVHRRMDRNELLETSHAPETGHRPLSSSKRQGGFFSAIVQMPATLLAPAFPITLMAARYDRYLSVTAAWGFPYRFIAFFRNFNAEALSRVFVTYDSSTSPHDQPRAKGSESDHGSSQRPRSGAIAIADFASCPPIGAFGSCARSKCRSGPPGDGPSHGRCRSLAHGADLPNYAMRAET